MSLPSITCTLVSATPATPSAGVGAVVPGIDWALDADGDLDFSSGSLRYTQGIEAIAQGIRIRVLMVAGEWFLDLDLGVPWFTEILGRKPTIARVRALLRKAIIAAPGVLEILSIDVSIDSSTRRLTATWSVSTDVGELTQELAP